MPLEIDSGGCFGFTDSGVILSVHKILALTPIEASKYNGITATPKKVQVMEKWSFITFAGRSIRRERVKSMIIMLSMIFSMMILILIVNTMGSVELPEKDKKQILGL